MFSIYRLLISLFFLTFSVSSYAVGMGGSTTYKYYKTLQASPQVCSESEHAVCAAHGSYIESTNDKTKINVLSCIVYVSGVYITYGKTVTEQQTYPPPTHNLSTSYT